MCKDICIPIEEVQKTKLSLLFIKIKRWKVSLPKICYIFQTVKIWFEGG